MEAEAKKPEPKSRKRFMTELATGVPAALGVRALGELGRQGANKLQERLRPERFAPEEMGRPFMKHPRVRAFSTAHDILEEMKRKKVDLPINIGPSSLTNWMKRGRGPWTATDIMASTPSAPVVMHEIGHAAKPAFGNAWRSLVFASSDKPGLQPADMSGVNLLRAGLLLGAIHEPDDKHKAARFVHEHAPMLAGLTYLPELAEEARATGSAIRGAYKLHSMAGVKEVLRDLGPAYLGYALPAAATVGGLMLARAIGHRVKRKLSEKNAGAGGLGKMPEPKMTGQLRLSTVAANMAPVGQLKPKTTPPHPGNLRGNFAGTPTAKPPSLAKYYRDFTKSLTPGRGART